MRACLSLVVLAALAVPAQAQSIRSEQELRGLNRSIETQSRQRNRDVQNQFESGQRRQSVDRQQNIPALPSRSGRICAPGQISC